jgi:hypothetical protein
VEGLEVTGLDELVAMFEKAQVHAAANVVKAGNVFGSKVKRIWRALDSGLAHAPGYPRSIDYDLTIRADGIEVEIGPHNIGQGALGGLIEFGSAHNPPHGSGAKALAVSAGDLERGVAMAMGNAL